MNHFHTTLLIAACFAGPAIAAEPSTDAAAKAQYEAERARCASGTTGQDQASCIKSAGAAYDAIRQNRLHDANSNFKSNALARCASLSASDRVDCESRVAGEGTSSGSVKDGGVIKETVTKGDGPAKP